MYRLLGAVYAVGIVLHVGGPLSGASGQKDVHLQTHEAKKG